MSWKKQDLLQLDSCSCFAGEVSGRIAKANFAAENLGKQAKREQIGHEALNRGQVHILWKSDVCVRRLACSFINQPTCGCC